MRARRVQARVNWQWKRGPSGGRPTQPASQSAKGLFFVSLFLCRIEIQRGGRASCQQQERGREGHSLSAPAAAPACRLLVQPEAAHSLAWQRLAKSERVREREGKPLVVNFDSVHSYSHPIPFSSPLTPRCSSLSLTSSNPALRTASCRVPRYDSLHPSYPFPRCA